MSLAMFGLRVVSVSSVVYADTVFVLVSEDE